MIRQKDFLIKRYVSFLSSAVSLPSKFSRDVNVSNCFRFIDGIYLRIAEKGICNLNDDSFGMIH